MPYIKCVDRNPLTADHPRTAGELNWALTRTLVSYLSDHGESYQTYNDMMGALEGAKLEFYRRKIAPYEDQKIRDNGNVW